MIKITEQEDLIEFTMDDFSMEVDNHVVDYNKANDLAKDEIQDYYPNHDFLNPYNKGDIVSLKVENRSRFAHIVSPKNEVVKIGEVLGNNQVNVAMWDSYPSVIKNVSIKDISILANNKKLSKARYYAITAVRAIIPNWYINKPLKAYYKETIDLLKIKKKNPLTRLILYVHSKLSNE